VEEALPEDEKVGSPLLRESKAALQERRINDAVLVICCDLRYRASIFRIVYSSTQAIGYVHNSSNE
jgi:hypothetical protein